MGASGAERAGSLTDHAEAWTRSLEARGLARRSVAQRAGHVHAVLRSIASEAALGAEELGVEHWRGDLLERAVAGYRMRPDRRYREGGPTERAAGSVRQRVVALQGFGRWLLAQNLVEENPAAALATPRSTGSTTEALSVEDARLVLEAAALSRAPERDQLVAALALTMGCTLQEIAALEVGDRSGGSLTIRTGSRRRLPLSPAAARAWEEWMPVREALLARHGLTSKKLILSLRARKVERAGVQVSTLDTAYSGVGEILSRLVGAAGLERGRAQLLRASFATIALSSGSHSLAQLRVQLGCRSIEALRPYAQLAELDLAESARSHPLGR